MNKPTKVDFTNYTEINNDIRFGKPCIKGIRLSVYDVLTWYAFGTDMKEISEDFPQLNKNQIPACLSYTADKKRKLKIA